MPFERYLRDDGHEDTQSYDDHTRAHTLGIASTPFSNHVQFQIPQFMLNGPPTLAPGGGAEVLPASMFNQAGNLASSWFSNNGFSPENFALSPSARSYTSSDEQLKNIDQPQPSHPFDFQNDDDVPPSGTSDALSHPLNSTLALHMSLSARDLLSLSSGPGFHAPSPLGLPVYSASGFDLMSILARVATRPHPKIHLGPVDLTCSFVVVDVRRYDRPIVYCSPTFCELTGYSESEVLGRNCRFLQSPDGKVGRGEERRFVAPETVSHLYKHISADKECQASIINYRKNGQAFINLVTVIPVAGGVYNRPEEAEEVVYQVGFQVDLTEQPNAILERLKDGSYMANFGAGSSIAPAFAAHLRSQRPHSLSSNAISKDLRTLLSDSDFVESLPLSTAGVAPSAVEKSEGPQEVHQQLNLLLLENSPDFVHVLSLKGSFLYVAPSVRRVLGFEPEELVGKSISDYCHPADLVPLMRELKESSITPGSGYEGQGPPTIQAGPGPPKTVDLLFRAQSKSQGYVWMECRGRLHVEPGKGRKAIILSGRARGMPSMQWDTVARAGGLTSVVRDSETNKREGSPKDIEREFWGTISKEGSFLVVGTGVRDVLGWGPGEMIGKALLGLILGEGNAREVLQEKMTRMSGSELTEPAKIVCDMSGKDGRAVSVQVVLYQSREQTLNVSSLPTICQIKRLDSLSASGFQSMFHPHDTDVYEELETGRGSSWQYELQQLKFANQRLTEEVDALEAAIQLNDPTRNASQQLLTATYTSDHNRPPIPVSRPIRVDDPTWGTPHLRDYDTQRSLKRSWGSDSVPS